MFRLSLIALLMASLVPSSAFAHHNEPPADPPPSDVPPADPPRAHVQAKRSPCPPDVAQDHKAKCLPVGKQLAHKPVDARVVLTHARPAHHRPPAHVSYGRRVSPNYLAAQRALLAPPPPVRDMSGYRTTVYVAPAGTPYPLTQQKPGDYLCTTDNVPLGTKVVGMHSPKPHPPCGYKWVYDGGSGKGYWWLVPDPNYGVRR